VPGSVAAAGGAAEGVAEIGWVAYDKVIAPTGLPSLDVAMMGMESVGPVGPLEVRVRLSDALLVDIHRVDGGVGKELRHHQGDNTTAGSDVEEVVGCRGVGV